MDRTRRVIFFAAIIVIAVITAMPFWREPPPQGAAAALLPNSATLSTKVDPTVLHPTTEPTLVVPQESTSTFRRAIASPSLVGHLAETEIVSDPNRLEIDPAPDAPVGFQDSSISGSLRSPRANRGDILFGEHQKVETTQNRLHTIIDGDTLPILANRYLGSTDRANEIFQANRDILSHPELLPLGETLRIPAR